MTNLTTSVTTTRTPLPSPTGPFAVGRTSTEVRDPSRREIYSSNPGDVRELALWLWYPAGPGGGEPAPYLPAAWSPVAQYLGLEVDGLASHALADAPTGGEGRHPVLLASPSGFSPLLLAALAEELASHGYVVVGVNHTYETMVTPFADGRMLPLNPEALGGALGPQTGDHTVVFAQRAAVCEYKAADLVTVADHLAALDAGSGPLAGRLDLGRLGAFGHSFGGNAALEWCRHDRRCRAAVNLDGALWSEVGRCGLDQPALQVLAEHPEFDVTGEEAVAMGAAPSAAWFEAERTLAHDGWRVVGEHARTARIAGARHLSFMDIPFLPASAGSPARAMLAAVTIEPQRMWRVTADLLLGFFGEQLDGVRSSLLDGDTAGHPEVSFDTPGAGVAR